MGNHEKHQLRLKRDSIRRQQRGGSTAKFRPRDASTGQRIAAIFVLLAFLASLYVAIHIGVGNPEVSAT